MSKRTSTVARQARELYLSGLDHIRDGDGAAPRDQRIAAALFRRAAALGHAEATYEAAVCFHKGSGVRVSLCKAFALYQKAANSGSHDALYALAMCYFWGHGVGANETVARRLLKKAAACHHPMAMCVLGMSYCFSKCRRSPKHGFRLIRASAAGGCVEALRWLAACYLEGVGTPKNSVRAFRAFQVAARRHDALSYYELGECHEAGRGTPKNIKRALYWYKKAAGLGIANAQFALGRLYETGRPIRQNVAKAVEYYRLAALGGQDDAMVRLSDLLGGAEETAKEAKEWSRRARRARVELNRLIEE